ncbi:Bromodomain adjacent to zinc finger domain protein 1A [Camellia lanceoleosa]|uniref:Bromodomain adjacent to zinc finger domain protein 1A n=1 Tax=Camellia lanceoleosa TaxID=1840588 RepID=A0ACC0J6D8_9ERIC|nr:Bromodomain adjacent to zinc finger domain protein 1A [Camellia lanceoleosa]
MPLYKRKPFALVERPKDLEPHELVFQVRFTKEIFRDYGEYLNRINLYRQRVWTCKVTAKTNLTYEEALVSEKRATEKVQQFPKELVAPVLRDVQFSMLTLKDLVNKIATKLQENVSEGTELYGKRNSRVYPCKIIKVIVEEADKTQYEVVWLDNDKKITGNAVVNGEDLVRKKLPFTRDVLKSFIRESTYRSVPWVLHDKLARKHGISIDPPEELRSKFSFQDGRVVSNRKRSRNEEDRQNTGERNKEELRKCKRKKLGKEKSEGLIYEENAEKEDNRTDEPIKYPIDDLLVQPAVDDPVFTERPSLSRGFNVPMNCVGDLLMVWDFCSSFSSLLHLWPFSLADFENALCHKDSNLVLIVETHSAVLRMLIKDNRNYTTTIEKKKRKPKITLVTWTEYLCDFLEMVDVAELSTYVSTIRRGDYGLLDVNAKLGIVRDQEKGGSIGGRKKKREDKERLKAESDSKEITKGHNVESAGSSLNALVNGNHSRENGDIADKWKQVDTTEKRYGKQQKMEAKAAVENTKDSARKGAQKMTTDDRMGAKQKRSKEQRKEYIEREMEKRFIRTNSLGKDRYYNRYWFFKRDGRIFVESSDSAEWGYYDTKEELGLYGLTEPKKVSERALKKQLDKYYDRICSALLCNVLLACMGAPDDKSVQDHGGSKADNTMQMGLGLKLHKRSKEVAREIAMDEAVLRRSTRVRAPPRDSPAVAFLRYVNKWKED